MSGVKKNWKIVLGLIFIIYGIFNLISNTVSALLCLILGVVLSSAWIFKNTKYKKNSEHTIRSQCREHVGNLDEEIKKSSEKYEHIKFKVKGVTFKNDDGHGRQPILRKIKFNDPPFEKITDVKLDKYEYNGEPALGVYVNGFQVGNVPKELVQYILDNLGRVDCVSAFEPYGGNKIEGTDERTPYGAEVYLRLFKEQ